MGHINYTKLLIAIMSKEPLDTKALLADVDRDAVIRAVEKSKAGLPQPIRATTQPMEEAELQKMSRVNRRLLDTVWDAIHTDPEKALTALRIMRKNYPKVPCLYNYLAIACHNSGRDEEERDVIYETIEKFPDYIFGKTMLAEYRLSKGAHQKIPEIFSGEVFDLGRLYPDRTVFHISEARAFMGVTGRYFARANKINRALFNYFNLLDLGSDHPAVKQLADEIINREIGKLVRRAGR